MAQFPKFFPINEHLGHVLLNSAHWSQGQALSFQFLLTQFTVGHSLAVQEDRRPKKCHLCKDPKQLD